jgi:hypothetical protein
MSIYEINAFICCRWRIFFAQDKVNKIFTFVSPQNIYSNSFSSLLATLQTSVNGKQKVELSFEQKLLLTIQEYLTSFFCVFHKNKK